tara:strand:+ start:543 stop:1397 length:855 start_codon:yes stop_codon:yes gene_type:complete
MSQDSHEGKDCEGAHTHSYVLRHDELGPGGYFTPSVLLGVLQEAAIDGSAARGFPMSYYRREGAFWMLRRITFRYERPLRHGDALEVTTWVSRVGKTSPTREYRIDSASGGECIARARTYWVYMDMATGKSKEIPDDLRQGFAPTGESLQPVLEVPSGPLLPGSNAKSQTRKVTLSDVDGAGHAKCCRYVSWLDDLIGSVSVEAGGRPGATSFGSFDLQLLSATITGDRVRLLAQPDDVWRVDLSTNEGQVVARAALWPCAVNPTRTEFLDLDVGLRERLSADP